MTRTTASVTEATAATPGGSVTRLWSARGCQNARTSHANAEVNTASRMCSDFATNWYAGNTCEPRDGWGDTVIGEKQPPSMHYFQCKHHR